MIIPQDSIWRNKTFIIIVSVVSIGLAILSPIQVHDQSISEKNYEQNLKSDINGLSCPWLKHLANEGVWFPSLSEQLAQERMKELKC